MDRRVTPIERRRAIADRVAAGDSISQVARDMKCNPGTVVKFCNEFGVPTPGPGNKRDNATARPPRPEYREQFEQLGPPPEDSLELVPWAGKHVAIALKIAATTDEFDTDNLARVKLIDKLANTINSLIPKQRLLEAEDTVRGYQRKVQGESPGPEMVDGSGFRGKSYRAAPVRSKGR